ncbi:hypothetical protein KY317_04010 [Candidatus Woesearchaeota archaeon]|nr:hypothetical protein [Candidatus Woesearchaeota archaeon]
MALFGLGKKKEEPVSKSNIPVDAVLQMKQQGYSNNQIVQELQRQNYTTTQIFDALSQADMAAMPQPGQPQIQEQPSLQQPPQQPPQQSQEYPAFQEPQQPPQSPLPQQPSQPQPIQEIPPPQEQYQYPYEQPETSSEKIEEVAEAIIEEKWEELSKGVQKIIEWKNQTESRLGKMQGELRALKKSFDDLHKGVLGKLSEYDKGIRDVGTDIKAMEGVFKKVIPTFTENVSELSRISKTLKSKKK